MSSKCRSCMAAFFLSCVLHARGECGTEKLAHKKRRALIADSVREQWRIWTLWHSQRIQSNCHFHSPMIYHTVCHSPALSLITIYSRILNIAMTLICWLITIMIINMWSKWGQKNVCTHAMETDNDAKIIYGKFDKMFCTVIFQNHHRNRDVPR